MKSSRIRRRSGHRATELALALVMGVLLTACNYGFQGGGFPPHIRTVYIAPFENETPQFDLEQMLYRELLQELPRQLGIRVAGEASADAVLRGRIIRYDDAAQNYRPGAGTQPAPDIISNQVQISIAAELIDVRDNIIRWESRSLVGRGEYRPDTESDREGQLAAIQNLIEQIVDGAQSQW